MQVSGDMNLEAVFQLTRGETADTDELDFTARMLDSDGDGRGDLMLVDEDDDGTIDSVVRCLDVDKDGVNDTYVTYNSDGEVRSIGRVGADGELEVIYEEPGLFDQILAGLGLADLESPEEALFTSLNDPYIVETYGSFGEDVPEESLDVVDVAPSDIVDLNEADYADLSAGASLVDEAEAESEADAETAAAESETPKSDILEVGDAGGGFLYARVDENGDGIADRTDNLDRTVDGWEADVDKDGLKETVAFDVDKDGRVESVDTSGKGDWAGSTQAWEVVPQPSDLVDDGLYDGQPGDPGVIDVAADTVTADYGSADAGADSGSDSGSSSYDSDVGSGDSYDSGGSADAGDTSADSTADDPEPTA